MIRFDEFDKLITIKSGNFGTVYYSTMRYQSEDDLTELTLSTHIETDEVSTDSTKLLRNEPEKLDDRIAVAIKFLKFGPSYDKERLLIFAKFNLRALRNKLTDFARFQ